MAYTKYSLTPANNTAAPPDGAPEGMLPSAVNDTMRDMMAQIRDCGDGIRDGTYTMTAPKITGGTITGAAFTGNTFTSPVISGGSINNTPIGATTANTGAFTTLSATGVTTVQAGTVSAPAITTSGDTNTGIFFPAADTIAFTEGGTEAMRLDSSGNMGVGTSSPVEKLTVVGAISTTTDMVLKDSGLTARGYIFGTSSGLTYRATSGLPHIFQNVGTELMRIDSSGNVMIANTTGASFTGNASNLFSLGSGSGNAGMTLYSGTSSQGAISFADGTTGDQQYRGYINYAHNLDALLIGTAGAERMRITSNGQVGIGTSSPTGVLSLVTPSGTANTLTMTGSGTAGSFMQYANTGGSFYVGLDNSTGTSFGAAYSGNIYHGGAYPIIFWTNGTERMRIDSSGNLLVGTTTSFPGEGNTTTGMMVSSSGTIWCSRSSYYPLNVNRSTNDGTLVSLRQDGNEEGTISVSGTTVSYNGGHLSRWSQLPDGSKDDTILKGTVLTNLDDMCVWTKDGTVLDNEQLNKMKVSDVEGDTNVAGVFVNWTRDEQCNTDDMNVAMTGDMIIRIAEGVVVQKGDLLMSAGDGTAKPQGDDIVRSKTIAKVTSNHVTCTYADGSYCVPCVLMAC